MARFFCGSLLGPGVRLSGIQTVELAIRGAGKKREENPTRSEHCAAMQSVSCHASVRCCTVARRVVLLLVAAAVSVSSSFPSETIFQTRKKSANKHRFSIIEFRVGLRSSQIFSWRLKIWW